MALIRRLGFSFLVPHPSKGIKQLASSPNVLAVQSKDSCYLLARKHDVFVTKHLHDFSTYKKIDLRLSFSKQHPGMCIEDLARRCLDSVHLDGCSLTNYASSLMAHNTSHTALIGFISAIALIQTKSTSLNKNLDRSQSHYSLASDTPAYIREALFATNPPQSVFTKPDPTRDALSDVVSPFLKASLFEPRSSIAWHDYSKEDELLRILRPKCPTPVIEVFYDRGLLPGNPPASLEFFLRLPPEVQRAVVDYIRVTTFQASSAADALEMVVINAQTSGLFF